MEGPSNGVGLTVLDSITTMHVMGLRVELAEALEFIKTRLSFRKEIEGSTFETSIRMLGSLLSMYELTGEQDKKLLDMARDIGDRLLWSYNTTGGLPHSTVGFSSHRHFNQQWIGGSAVLSEFGTVQLEMRTLSFHTKDPTYDIKTTHVMDIIDARCPQDMLCPCYMNKVSVVPQWLGIRCRVP
ncbi:mannosyl-oligosaccharide alpha-1,2-mannosidase, putative [Bodo saltans]|uniref:alpha-1,2-Mannosidase n=1 Tax=Bodo saltans TaxID=75058 RepID=A0A0S4IWN0_BODSA|nr:mannosyl-oligosaccharide alpha-1,2-mannosidase, putative [Bodo saltans]|eukprot:CUG31001.1 mannosyl-oligosaccharide alpha-1,2-mannosidase, putative [Bodo saltans]